MEDNNHITYTTHVDFHAKATIYMQFSTIINIYTIKKKMNKKLLNSIIFHTKSILRQN